eukprot:jgi/Ulvmu1/10472/UM064_0009.1
MQRAHGSASPWRTWQSPTDKDLRREVLSKIYKFCKEKAGSGDDRRLVGYAKRLEEELYQRASSLEQYKDVQTLHARLTEAARTIQQRNGPAEPQNGSVSAARHPGSNGNPFRTQAGTTSGSNWAAPGPMMIPAPGVPATSGVGTYNAAKMERANMISTPRLDGVGQRSSGAHPWPHGHGDTGSVQPATNSMQAPGMAPVNGASQHMSVPRPAAAPAAATNAQRMPTNATQEPMSREKLQKNQRLLMFLRHCAKCTNSNCNYGTSCTTGKELWNHITSCKDQHCQYPRCLHSRNLLRHYQKCDSVTCPICVPIKQVVTESGTASGMYAPPQNGYMQQQPSNGMVAPMQISSMSMGMAVVPRQNSGMVPTQPAPEAPQQGSVRPRPEVPAPSTPMAPETGITPPAGITVPAPRKRQKADMDHIKTKLGASLLETFSQMQLDQHVDSCQKDMEKSPPPKRATDPAAMEMEDTCDICRATYPLYFEPTPKNCASCGQKIKKQAWYHSSQTPQAVWCNACFTSAGEQIRVHDTMVKKEAIVSPQKQRNVEVAAEHWVACDGCNRWVHMVCGLFNNHSNKDDTKFLCPWCLKDMQRAGTWKPVHKRPQSMLSAEDLPRTELSDHMEDYLKRQMEADLRQRKAAAAGGAVQVIEGLTIRVVNITRKAVDVKQKYLHAFQTQGYPAHFPYKQKVILLFQRIEGVDVLLFIVYVQEYGEDAPAPNKNTVYLSYLDSVRYFQPEGKDAGGSQALRTHVYHEVLLAYMDQAVKLGMNAMYIWSCPPVAGDDYVLYCHPSRQKTPKAEKLREWYHSLLEKAELRGLVMFRSTMFDTFLPGGKDHAMMEPTSRLLPYFDGDFWPGEAEAQLVEIEKGASATNGKKVSKMRATSGKGKRLNVPPTLDGQLMQRLVENTIGSHQNGMKDDFIVAHFRTPCSLCAQYCDGVQYVLNKDKAMLPKSDHKSKSFDGIQLAVDGAERCDIPRRFACCKKCYSAAQAAEMNNETCRLPKQVSTLDLDMQDCPRCGSSMKDKDAEVTCEIFDSRTSYLSLCQSKFLQFDTLRRAKYSTMITLYYLHNPSDPEAISSSCSKCGCEIKPNEGWRCKDCPEYELCVKCYDAGAHNEHPHPLVRSKVENHLQQALTPEQRRMRSETLRRTMMLLEHAASCNNASCVSKSCRKVKQLHMHYQSCTRRTQGNCSYCRHLVCLLSLHAKRCTKDNCPVPECGQYRQMRQHQAAQQEAMRRQQYVRIRGMNAAAARA